MQSFLPTTADCSDASNSKKFRGVMTGQEVLIAIPCTTKLDCAAVSNLSEVQSLAHDCCMNVERNSTVMIGRV
jgi:hypothetical protein